MPQNYLMAKHNVYFELPLLELNNADARFNIYEDEEKLGSITISKGSFDYYPRNRKNPVRISWSALDEMIQKYEEENG